MRGCPFLEASVAHEVAIVLQQFFEAGSSDVGQLDFCFLGGAAGLAAFEDVLFAGAGSLHHLVVGAATLVYETVAEAEGGVINHERLLVGEKVLVAAMGRDETFRCWKGREGRMGHKSAFVPWSPFCPSVFVVRHGQGLSGFAGRQFPASRTPRWSERVWRSGNGPWERLTGTSVCRGRRRGLSKRDEALKVGHGREVGEPVPS